MQRLDRGCGAPADRLGIAPHEPLAKRCLLRSLVLDHLRSPSRLAWRRRRADRRAEQNDGLTPVARTGVLKIGLEGGRDLACFIHGASVLLGLWPQLTTNTAWRGSAIGSGS